MKAITNDLKVCGIYMLINTKNGKRYIGSSINIRERLWKHRSLLRHNHHDNPHLQNAWNKYGEDCFDYSLLEICSTEDRFNREQFYVNTLKPEYNICIEVVNNPPVTEESKRKHSETRKLKMASGEIEITNNKPVYVYYKNGNFVGYWKSIRQAAKDLNIHYSGACRVIQGKDSQVKGYKFFTEKQSSIESFSKPTNSKAISKTYIVKDGNSELEFQGRKEVANYLNTSIEMVQFYISTKKLFHKRYMIYVKSAV